MNKIRLAVLALFVSFAAACSGSVTGPEAGNINGLGTPQTTVDGPAANINGLGTP